MCVPSPGTELIEHELRVGGVVRRAELIGLGGHSLEPGDLVRRVDAAIECGFRSLFLSWCGRGCGRGGEHRTG